MMKLYFLVICILLLVTPIVSTLPPAPTPRPADPARAENVFNIFLSYIGAETAFRTPSQVCVPLKHGPGIATPVGAARAYRSIVTNMYNTWTVYDTSLESVATVTPTEDFRPLVAEVGERETAVTYAGYFMMDFLMPARANLQNLKGVILSTYNVNVSDWQNDRPGVVAKSMTDPMMTYMLNDGSNMQDCYRDTSNYAAVNSPALLDSLATATASRAAIRNELSWSDPNKTGRVKGRLYSTPHAGRWTPYAVHPMEILAPPLPSREILRTQFKDVEFITTTLNDNDGERRLLAEYWADGPRSTLPPGHWADITRGVARQLNYSLEQSIKALFVVTNAVYDAGIACWATKTFYDSVRPATYIPLSLYSDLTHPIENQYRGFYCPFGTVEAWAWQPYQSETFITPPFSEYVSGHSTFSSAAAEALKYFTESDFFPSPGYQITFQKGKSLFEPQCFPNGTNIYNLTCTYRACSFNSSYNSATYYFPQATKVITFAKYDDAANSAGISRLYGGIHIAVSNDEGRKLGKRVAESVLPATCAQFGGNRCTASTTV